VYVKVTRNINEVINHQKSTIGHKGFKIIKNTKKTWQPPIPHTS